MKKIIATGIAMLAIVITCNAQWTTSGTDIYNSNTGNVGIGGAPRRQLSVGSYLDIYSGAIATTTTPSIRASSAGNLILNSFSGTGNVYISSDHGSGMVYIGTSSSSTRIALNGAASGNSYFNSGGSLGINTASPESGFMLDVNGLGAIGTQASARVYMGTVDATHAFIQSRDNSINQNLGFSAASYSFGSGNVGIGTTSPGTKLDITDLSAANTFGQNALTIQSSYDGTVIGGGSRIVFKYNSANTEAADIRSYTFGPLATGLAFGTGWGAVTPKMVIDNSGNVGIGTTDPQGYKLAVNGDMIATSIKVKPHGSWPDYVFKPQYNLPSLSDVKTYIDQNQHLPDMPSESEVAKEGINLGEIVKLQTKKIEELTLYLIEKDKKEQEQTELNKKLEEEIQDLKNQFKNLKDK